MNYGEEGFIRGIGDLVQQECYYSSQLIEASKEETFAAIKRAETIIELVEYRKMRMEKMSFKLGLNNYLWSLYIVIIKLFCKIIYSIKGLKICRCLRLVCLIFVITLLYFMK